MKIKWGINYNGFKKWYEDVSVVYDDLVNLGLIQTVEEYAQNNFELFYSAVKNGNYNFFVTTLYEGYKRVRIENLIESKIILCLVD